MAASVTCQTHQLNLTNQARLHVTASLIDPDYDDDDLYYNIFFQNRTNPIVPLLDPVIKILLYF